MPNSHMALMTPTSVMILTARVHTNPHMIPTRKQPTELTLITRKPHTVLMTLTRKLPTELTPITKKPHMVLMTLTKKPHTVLKTPTKIPLMVLVTLITKKPNTVLMTLTRKQPTELTLIKRKPLTVLMTPTKIPHTVLTTPTKIPNTVLTTPTEIPLTVLMTPTRQLSTNRTLILLITIIATPLTLVKLTKTLVDALLTTTVMEDTVIFINLDCSSYYYCTYGKNPLKHGLRTGVNSGANYSKITGKCYSDKDCVYGDCNFYKSRLLQIQLVPKIILQHL